MSSVLLIKYMRQAVNTIKVVPVGEDANNVPPYFYIGHRKDINNQFKIKDRRSTKDKKYPAIVLSLDTEAEAENGFFLYSPTVWLLALSKDAYTTEQRFTEVFEPVLFPLYKSFIQSLVKSPVFQWSGEQSAPAHSMVDRYYVGTPGSEGNKNKLFDDPLDAVEIRDLKINISIKYCLP